MSRPNKTMLAPADISQVDTDFIDVSVPWWAEQVLEAYYSRSVRYVVIYGGYASAKSETVCRLLANMAARDRMRLACLRETLESIKDSSKAMLEGVIDTMGLRPWYKPELKTRIEALNGSEFFFSGLHDVTVERIKGWFDVNVAFVEEANFLTRKSCDILFNRPRARGSQIWLVFNPLSRNDPVWLDFIAEGAERRKHALVINVNYDSNPWFGPEMELERAIDERTQPLKYKHKWLGEPLADTDNPFDAEAMRRCLVGKLSGKSAQWYGIDLAKHVDYTTIVGLDEDGMPAEFERFQASWDSTMKRVEDVVGDSDALIDASGVGDPIYEKLSHNMRRLEPFVFTSRSRQALLEGLAASFAHQEVGILEGVMYDEASAFRYEINPKTRTVRYAAPEEIHDDSVMGLALADECRRQNPRRGVPIAEVA